MKKPHELPEDFDGSFSLVFLLFKVKIHIYLQSMESEQKPVI
jgi:hypothetical protein